MFSVFLNGLQESPIWLEDEMLQHSSSIPGPVAVWAFSTRCFLPHLPPTSPQTRTLAWLHVSSQHKKSVCILVDLFLRKNLHQGSCGNNFLLCEWKTPDEKEQVRQHPQHLCNCRGWYGVKASCGLQSSPQKKTVFPWWRGKFPAPGLRSHVPLGCGKHGNGGMRNTSFS